MNKIYVVSEVQDWSTSFVIGVCPTLELANKLKEENERIWDLEDCEITAEKFDEMLSALAKADESIEDPLEVLIAAFPEYPVSDIEKALYGYSHRSYIETRIDEVPLLTNNTDITLYGIDRRRASEG